MPNPTKPYNDADDAFFGLPCPTGWRSRWDYWDWWGACEDELRRLRGLGVLRELRTKAGNTLPDVEEAQGELFRERES